MKVTGIGFPSECVNYYDAGIIDEMWLWNIYDYGYLVGYTLYGIVKGDATGAADEKISAGRMGEFTIETREVDGGTMMGDGFLFGINIIHEWVDLL